jgi:hypothetical protein
MINKILNKIKNIKFTKNVIITAVCIFILIILNIIKYGLLSGIFFTIFIVIIAYSISKILNYIYLEK